MWGALVIVVAMAAGAALAWWCIKEDDRELDLDLDVIANRVPRGSNWTFTGHTVTADDVVHAFVPIDTFNTQQIAPISAPPAPMAEPLIIDMRPVEKAPVVDELGEWHPWEHEIEQPLVLGHVLMTRRWRTLTAAGVGMVAS